MNQDDTQITLSIDNRIATITLNRPEKLNALTPAMLAQLEGMAAALEQNQDVRVVLLTGSGRAFCVGADIYAWSALEPLQMWRQWIRDGHRVFDRLARLPQPLIAVLNGYTFGGGLELALAADLRLAAETVQLALPETTLGTIPGWAGTQRLPRLIGAARAKQMIFTGARIDAVTAERWGLVNEVVAADALDVRAHELAEIIARNAPVAVQAAKQLIDGDLASAVTLEALASGMTAFTADLQEGLAAFRERRSPDFQGR
ncbi:MAG: enoyl-CoA hydratase/isomerase family protein [Caldilineaceae bacterium]|nr:enoyl-CoA hydratase/isomerase family protein [Caldilineaceae bacterium]